MNTTDIIIQFLDTPRLWSASRKDACGCRECRHLHWTGNTPEEALANLLEDELEREIEREPVEPVKFMEDA